MRKIKFRESISDKKYGDYWEEVFYGTFHGWGVKNGVSAVIVEIEYSRKTVNSSRDFDAKESPEKHEHSKGKVVLVPLTAVMWFDPIQSDAPLPDRQPIIVWEFHKAPKELQVLTSSGGDEDWLAEVPPEYADKYIGWLQVGSFGVCDVEEKPHPTKEGWTIYIGSHA